MEWLIITTLCFDYFQNNCFYAIGCYCFQLFAINALVYTQKTFLEEMFHQYYVFNDDRNTICKTM